MTVELGRRNDCTGRRPRFHLSSYILLAALMLLLGLLAGLRWGLMADSVDERVTATHWAEEGPEFKLIVLDDGRDLTIDDALMTRLTAARHLEGRHLQVSPGDSSVRLDGKEVPLRWSWSAMKMMLLLGGLAIVALVRQRQARRLPPAATAAAVPPRPAGAEV